MYSMYYIASVRMYINNNALCPSRKFKRSSTSFDYPFIGWQEWASLFSYYDCNNCRRVSSIFRKFNGTIKCDFHRIVHVRMSSEPPPSRFHGSSRGRRRGSHSHGRDSSSCCSRHLVNVQIFLNLHRLSAVRSLTWWLTCLQPLYWA